MAAFVRALRPGGILTVVDNVTFGLVRSREQASQAEVGPGEFEHYRNDSAAGLLRVAELHVGLSVVERRDVERTTSNQWLVRLRKG